MKITIKNTLKVYMTLLSLAPFAGSPVGFPPAIALTLFLIATGGIIAIFGHLKTATLNIAITSSAIMTSPLGIEQFHSVTPFLLYCIPVIIGFGGLFIGVTKIQNEIST